MRQSDPVRFRAGRQGLNTEERIPLDDERLFFLRVVYDENGKEKKYIVDFERAEDSHYELSPSQAQKLGKILEKTYERGGLALNLRAFFAQNKHDLPLKKLMHSGGVLFQEFHFY